jgi:hypothetical protein
MLLLFSVFMPVFLYLSCRQIAGCVKARRLVVQTKSITGELPCLILQQVSGLSMTGKGNFRHA